MPAVNPSQIRRVAVIGLGAIGMGWASYFAARGLDVFVYDADPEAAARTADYIQRAWQDLEQLGLVVEGASSDNVKLFNSIADAVRDAEYVQENGPENLSVKRGIIRDIEASCGRDVIVGSSTSALQATDLGAFALNPARIIICHPFNPAHLIPLVEISAGEQSSDQVQWARQFFERLAKCPIVLKREIYGHVANRLQYALYNEAARLFSSGVVSLRDIETTITQGLGLRWAFMGPFTVHHTAGGPGGIKGSFEKFEQRDRASTDRVARVVLDSHTKERLIAELEDFLEHKTVGEIEKERDRKIVDLLKAS